MMGFGIGLWGFGMLIMAAFWVIVIGGAVWLVTVLVRRNQSTMGANPAPAISSPAAPNQTPLDILKIRYAKGEITSEQFAQMKRDLGDG